MRKTQKSDFNINIEKLLKNFDLFTETKRIFKNIYLKTVVVEQNVSSRLAVEIKIDQISRVSEQDAVCRFTTF